MILAGNILSNKRNIDLKEGETILSSAKKLYR